LYGKHLSQAYIDEIVAPKDESRLLVLDWLSQQGLADKSTVTSRGTAITVTASVEAIENLLQAQYDTYSEFWSFYFKASAV
jgi:tripeptidyl-peptidase I